MTTASTSSPTRRTIGSSPHGLFGPLTGRSPKLSNASPSDGGAHVLARLELAGLATAWCAVAQPGGERFQRDGELVEQRIVDLVTDERVPDVAHRLARAGSTIEG